jgi:membrane associated rhomboid family serine protease
MSERDYWREDPGRSGFWATYPATKAILIGLPSIYVLLSFLASADPGAANAVYGLLALSPGDVLRRFHVWQLVTYALLHGGAWHVIGNCIGIYFFGRLVEQRIGTRRYLLFALGTVVAAALLFLLLSAIQSTRMPMIGASGFDFGVLILSALWYPNLTVLLFFILPAPLWAIAAIYAFWEVSMLFSQADGVAHSAHVAGALYGLLYYRYGERFDRVLGAFDRWRARQQLRKQQAHWRETEELRGEVDRILDKVNREGMSALTDKERRALREASERLRR